MIEKFKKYCTLRKNETYERYVFRNRLQKESESTEQFVTDLRMKSQSCNFVTLCDSMFRDQIVIGVQDKRVKMQLLKETDLTLEKAIKICQASECAMVQLKTFSDEKETAEVDVVRLANVDSIEDGQTASADEWIAHMDVNGTDVSLKPGPLCLVNILPMKDFQRLRKKPEIRHIKVNL